MPAALNSVRHHRLSSLKVEWRMTAKRGKVRRVKRMRRTVMVSTRLLLRIKK